MNPLPYTRKSDGKLTLLWGIYPRAVCTLCATKMLQDGVLILFSGTADGISIQQRGIGPLALP